MQRVNLISLSGNPYHIEEDAQERLRAYLDAARERLASNPDRAEILADLEQAVADQCRRRLPTGRSVFTLEELVPALAEIGEVELPGMAGDAAHRTGSAASPGPAGPTPDGGASAAAPGLRQISEGALVSGVCNGLARSLRVDLTLVRVIAVLLLFLSSGSLVLLYLVLMLLIPFAPLEHPERPLPALPAKCRELVQFVRAKLGAATS